MGNKSEYMGSNRITIRDIKRLCNAGSYERGERYFRNGSVTGIEYYAGTLRAKVVGTCLYEVTVNLENGIRATCTCPYDWGGYCKHIVATLLYYAQHYDEIEEKTEQTEQKVSEILSRISMPELKDFLLTAFQDDSSLKTHFLIRFADMEKEKSIDEYRKEVQLLIQESSGNEEFEAYESPIDFTPLRNLAKRHLARDNFMEGAKIYKAIAEEIAGRVSEFEDLEFYYEGDFSASIHDYAECIGNVKLDFPEKKEHIDYLFDGYTAEISVSFREYYGAALFILCTSEQDLLYVLKLLEKKIPRIVGDARENWHRSFHVRICIAAKLHILEKLNNKQEIFNTLSQYWELSHQYCLAHVKMLKKRGKIDEAVRIAEKGIELFPAHLTPDLYGFVNNYYEKHDRPKYRDNLMHLFYRTGSWKYYDALKNSLSGHEWHDVFQGMVSHLAGKDHFLSSRIIDMYLREKLYDRALDLVMGTEDLDVLAAYHRQLADRNPERYFQAYKTLIGELVERHKGRSYYRRAVTFLRKMRGIKGMEKNYNAFMNLLREKHRTRRAFLEEIRGL